MVGRNVLVNGPGGVKATEQKAWPGGNGQAGAVSVGRMTENKVSDFIKGRTIVEVWKNSSILMLKFADGDSVEIGWADKDGNPVDGEPVMLRRGRHVLAKTAVVGAKGQPVGS